VYGRRATPHEVLSALGERIADAYSLDEVLPRLAQLVTEATAASRADVWVRVGDELRQAAAWPHDPQPGSTVPLAGDQIPPLPESQLVFPIRHQAELLGAVAVSAPPNDPLGSADERLLGDLASQAGLVLRNIRLIEELRASRGRLVAAQDAERRRIERNLHDGAQQHLVALAVNLRLARGLVDGDPAQANAMLEQLQSDAAEALENLRDLARGIYPPLLADRGLAAALQSQAQKAAVRVRLETDGIGRYPMEAESAVYFCVLEALQNVAKYAAATEASVRIGASDGRLEFSVADDGAGFDERTTRPGSGITNMTDRVEALGGRLEIRSSPGSGTTVFGWVRATPLSPGT
jgi:signal transduction histidine kinase